MMYLLEQNICSIYLILLYVFDMYLLMQHFADILASEADERSIASELIDVKDCEPDEDLIVEVHVLSHSHPSDAS